MRIAAGVLMILSIFGGSIWISILHGLHIYGIPVFLVVMALSLAVIGGVAALRRKNYTLAFVGAICSLFFPLFGIPALILLVKRQREFEKEEQEEYDKAIELNPNHADAYYKRGDVYDEMGEYGKAIADYNKAIELDPNHALAYYNRGCAYGEIGEYEKAIADYNKAIELNPNDADAYYNRGLAYHGKGEVPKAVSDLEKCIGLSTDPELTEAAQQDLLEIKNSP